MNNEPLNNLEYKKKAEKAITCPEKQGKLVEMIKNLKPVNRALEQKPTWNEEEKARIDKIVDVLDWAEEKGYIRYSDWEDYICYVKSLRPQNIWKPSDEQIEALEHFVRSIGENGYASPYDNNTKLIYSLLKQLKQL